MARLVACFFSQLVQLYWGESWQKQCMNRLSANMISNKIIMRMCDLDLLKYYLRYIFDCALMYGVKQQH